MQKRSESDWQQLLEEYQQSGLTQKAFCEQKKICSKGLSRYKNKVNPSKLKVNFVQASPEAKRSHAMPVRVELGRLTIYLPLEQPVQTAQLIKALQ